MKKCAQARYSGVVLFVCGLLLFFSANSVFAQGFTGPVQNVTVLQVAQTYPDKAQAVLRGNIVMSLGGDKYLFRDSTGEFVIKIKQDKWWGLSVGPGDLLEVGGELKRDKKTGQVNYFDAKSIRRA